MLDQVGAIAARFGRSPALVIDRTIAGIYGAQIVRGFASPPVVAEFAGELTDLAAAALEERCRGCDVVVAVGGGKAIDAGKSVARRLVASVVTVPTIASNDGPASRGIAIYNEDHQLVRVDQLPDNPVAVIVDSGVIAKAPVRFLCAGVGDAIAKTFEAEACWAEMGLTKHGTRPTHSARAIARAAFETLRAHAIAAIGDAERHAVTEDLEATIEACVLLSAMGFENGGLSIAHSVTRGLMQLPGAKEKLHGEQVAYGTLVQLAAEARPDEEVIGLARFLRAARLPINLAMLGVADPHQADVVRIAELTMTSPHMRGRLHTPGVDAIAAAIHRVEALALQAGAATTRI